MLSIAKLKDTNAASSYYEHDDYYHGSNDQAPSSWWGEGARRLGLSGEVERTTFAQLLSGQLPSGAALEHGATRRLAGHDLTFSAPKSVSLLALLGGRGDVLDAHHRAVDEALTWLERNAVVARATVNGQTFHERTNNLVVARFRHNTSRELDPQLHTHAVVLNITQRADGAWRAMVSNPLFEAKMLAGALYRAQLAHELRQLGYAIDRTHPDGRFEVRGFTEPQLAAFSKRREQIEAALTLEGAEGAVAAARLTLMTRSAKRQVDRSVLRRTWQEEASHHQIELPIPQSDRIPSFDLEATAAAGAVRHTLNHLGERSAVHRGTDVLSYAMATATGRASPAAVVEATAVFHKKRHLVEVEPDIRPGHDFQPYWTTPEALRTEREILATVRRSRKTVQPILSQERAAAEIAQTAQVALTDGQRRAAKLILTTTDRVVGVQGYAGTGKTTVLSGVRAIAQKSGFEVVGLAPSAKATDLLRTDAGMTAKTVAQHLIDIHRIHPNKPNQLWVIDEMSMVGNRDALRLLQAAEHQHARVVLVGDHAQLPSIAAGRVFRLLQERGMAYAEMKEVLRQRNAPDYLEVVYDAVNNHHASSIQKLKNQGRIHTIPDRTARIQAVANEYVDSTINDRHEVLVVTAQHRDRRAINDAIRTSLRQRGILTGPTASASVLVDKRLTDAERAVARNFEVGDIIRAGRAYRRLGIESNEYVTVAAVDPDTNRLQLARATQPAIECDAA